jgi:uncharacterized protein (DUF1697 family)
LGTCIAPFRGINVGSGKRVSMQDLKGLFEAEGLARVRTLLNSGNVLFEVARPNLGKLAQQIETAFQLRFGFTSNVAVLTAERLKAIVAANPLLEAIKDPKRHFVAFASDEAKFTQLLPLAGNSWHPDALVIGESAAYLWCELGALDSPSSRAFGKAAGTGVTSRNWATVLKIQAAAALPP